MSRNFCERAEFGREYWRWVFSAGVEWGINAEEPFQRVAGIQNGTSFFPPMDFHQTYTGILRDARLRIALGEAIESHHHRGRIRTLRRRICSDGGRMFEIPDDTLATNLRTMSFLCWR